jgi:hypothetical protein
VTDPRRPKGAASRRSRSPRTSKARALGSVPTPSWKAFTPARRHSRAPSGALSSIGRRRQPQGRLAGLVAAATGLISSRNRGARSKKGPVALALTAGAAGLAVLKRRRSAAANEPKGQAFVDDQREPRPQAAVTRSGAGEPQTGQATGTGSDPARATGSSESKGDLE